MHVINRNGQNMLLMEYVLIIFSLFIAEHVTVDTDNVTEINRDQSRTNFHTTSEHLILKNRTNRRSVLLINSENILRSSSKRAKSLLYEEYDEEGKKINTVMMYNLDDVSSFFKAYLNTEVCFVKCDDN